MLALSWTLLTGCTSNAVYVLDQTEIVRVQKGQTFTGNYTGWFFSDRAVSRVMDTRIKELQ